MRVIAIAVDYSICESFVYGDFDFIFIRFGGAERAP
jgi:hypothetical protein